MTDLGTFPHCDQMVLHAPSECEYCDTRPDLQELRQVWGIAFTGQTVANFPGGVQHLPCPADYNRPPGSRSDHRNWPGNTPEGYPFPVDTEWLKTAEYGSRAASTPADRVTLTWGQRLLRRIERAVGFDG